MNTTPATDVFTCRQYGDGTLLRLYTDLLANPKSQRKGTWEANRVRTALLEMERRGIKAGGLRP